VSGGWRYLYRAIDRAGALVDVMLSAHRDLAAAKAFFAGTTARSPVSSSGRRITHRTGARFCRWRTISPTATCRRQLLARRASTTARQLRILISTIHQALFGFGKPSAETETDPTPAVPIRRSVHRDYVVCLECGWRGQTLRRHLTSRHGLSGDQYRARWKLPREHPLTAPGYSERRSGLAKELGLVRLAPLTGT
jgi:predicted transcriptional regulator